MNSIQDAAFWLQTLDFSAWSTEDNELADWLDMRDAPPFDVEWTRAFALLGDREGEQPLAPEELQSLKKLREAAYAKAATATNDTEVAAYISDDLDLLARAARMGLEDDWLTSLRRAYDDGRFPTGAL